MEQIVRHLLLQLQNFAVEVYTWMEVLECCSVTDYTPRSVL